MFGFWFSGGVCLFVYVVFCFFMVFLSIFVSVFVCGFWEVFIWVFWEVLRLEVFVLVVLGWFFWVNTI